MNISTGGPHLLLFERDQQLAALLSSELQLAGYETHRARTAVEVFDAIARHPIRLVLVNLSQAAAARREFWVALDTQRRGRGVQVLTFQCANIAGYGPRDPDDRPHAAIADVDVEGMLGIMNLVDAVRTRVPGAGSTMGSSMARIPGAGYSDPPPPPSTVSPAMTSGFAPPPPSPTAGMFSGDTVPRAPAFAENSVRQAPAQGNGIPASPQAQPPAGQHTFTEKIRAVLYPNQRIWTPQGSNAPPPVPENRLSYERPNGQSTAVPPVSSPPSSGATNMLQRLASGQTEIDGQREPGLAQLSRMLQQNQPAVMEGNYRNIEARQDGNFQNVQPARPTNQPPGMAGEAPPVVRPLQSSETIGTQPLRASPIQDIPIQRPGATTEISRRPDVLSRANYGQPPVQTSPAPLAAAPPPFRTTLPKMEPSKSKEEGRSQVTTDSLSGETPGRERESGRSREDQVYQVVPPQAPTQEVDAEDSATPNNALLLDIMQSLPPTQSLPPPMQQNQAQALNGRATRSLGSVLVEGHLVPQNRLEVAQNVQRMLRGVDLNYQLGEILLMFKLLTPDQLLAATLVSEGLITTAQVSALGRIRQELHSIGLEYDLENLVILFRILTPEQLREVRANWQG